MMSLVRASGEGGVVPAQKKCFASADAVDAAASATSATTSTTAARANERADLTGCTSTGRCERCRVLRGTAYPNRAKMNRTMNAEIGVFGGSGFYSFLDEVEEVEVLTPYG